MEKNDKFIIGIVLLIGMGILLLQYSNFFVITGNDLPLVNEVILNPGDSFDSLSNFSINNNSIVFKVGSQYKSYESGSIFYMLDSSNLVYNNFPEMEDGTHTINKYQLFFISNKSKINLQKYSKTYDIITQTITKNITIANETVYVDKPINVTVVEYVNQTVEKQVTVEPDFEYILNKYKIEVIAILAIGLVYYLTRKKK